MRAQAQLREAMVWGWDESHGLKPKKYQTDLCQMLTCAAVCQMLTCGAVRVKREQACGYGKLAPCFLKRTTLGRYAACRPVLFIEVQDASHGASPAGKPMIDSMGAGFWCQRNLQGCGGLKHHLIGKLKVSFLLVW